MVRIVGSICLRIWNMKPGENGGNKQKIYMKAMFNPELALLANRSNMGCKKNHHWPPIKKKGETERVQ